MKFTGSTKKRRIAICCAALMAVPLLIGAESNGNEEFVEDPFHDAGTQNEILVEEEIPLEPPAENLDAEENSGAEENLDVTVEEDINDENIGVEETVTIDETEPADDENSEEEPAADETPSENPFEERAPENQDEPRFFESGLEEEPESQTDVLIRDYMRQFDGRTVVEVSFEGAGEATLPTVKAAVMLHVGDDFDAETAIRDRNAIKALGYFYDAYQTFVEVPEGIMVTYHMLENPVLRNIEIIGNTIYDDKDLKKLVTVRRNSILNQNTLHDNLAAIQEKYHGDGYILMKITDMNVDTDGLLTLKINEGLLEDYKVKGNTKTKDYVVLREMRQKTGEPFNANMARRSIERVYNLGFFEDVNVKMQPGVEPNAVIMEINVKEKRTGTFGVGAGYSTREGLLGVVSISDTNFRGTGDAIGLAFETSADEDDAHGFSFSYRKPWLDSHETAGIFRIYNRTYQYYDYDTHGDLNERYMRKYSGGELTLSRPMSEYSTNYITLRQRKDTYKRNVVDGLAGDRSGPEGLAWRNYNFGTTRSIGLQHVTDTRDNIYNPTTGGRVALNAEFAGLLGGDFTFQKYDIEHQQFFKAGHAQVWALKAAYGVGEGHLTEFNQFRIGGQNSLRGYRDDQFRGSRMVLGTLEYRFPMARRVQGILFTDWGGAWNNKYFPDGQNIYGSFGTGVALNTPLGPLRLDYGRGKQGGRFHFSVGGGF